MGDALTGSNWSWRSQCRHSIAADLAKTVGRSYTYRAEHLERARPADASASGWRLRVWLEEVARALLYIPKNQHAGDLRVAIGFQHPRHGAVIVSARASERSAAAWAATVVRAAIISEAAGHRPAEIDAGIAESIKEARDG